VKALFAAWRRITVVLAVIKLGAVMRISDILAAAVCAVLIGGVTGSAMGSTITYDIKFKATNFGVVGGSGPPSAIPTVEGEFQISFDATKDQAETTSGITLDSLNMPLDSPIGFRYFEGAEFLWIGGTDHGVAGYGGSNDFHLSIVSWKGGHPVFFSFGYATASQFFSAGSGTVAVSIVPVAATPIPGASLLFISALGGLGFFGWRRRGVG
jgi:hypothetical protein